MVQDLAGVRCSHNIAVSMNAVISKYGYMKMRRIVNRIRKMTKLSIHTGWVY